MISEITQNVILSILCSGSRRWGSMHLPLFPGSVHTLTCTVSHSDCIVLE